MRKSSMTLLITSLTTAMALSFSPHVAKALYVSVDEPVEINIELAIRRIYFADQPWWSMANADTYIYAWGDYSHIADVPGVLMHRYKNWQDNGGQNIWYYDVDTVEFKYITFQRWDPNNPPPISSGNWNAHTVDITLDRSWNTVTLSTDSYWENESGRAPCTMSNVTYTY